MARTTGRLRTRGAASFGHDTEKWHGLLEGCELRGAASFCHDTEKWHGHLEGCELVVLLHLVTTLKSGTDFWKVANSWCCFIWSRHCKVARTTGRLRTRGAASFGHDTEKWHGLLEGCELVVLLHLVTTLKSGTDNWKVANSWCCFIWSRH